MFIGPMSKNIPVESLSFPLILSPNVLHSFIADVHVAFHDGFHGVGGNSGG